MRITNSMVTANTKSNININKMYHDKANSQVASGQKILRPSDDPIIAIRALRLNTSLSELNQYAEKNIPDAEAWFKATETALTQTDQVLTNIRHSLNQGSSQTNNNESVKDVLEELKQLRTQIYATGNADDAGRTVFTGYRTGEGLTFNAPEQTRYEIYEPISALDIEKLEYVSGKEDVDKNTLPTPADYTEQGIKLETVDRIRLAYDGLDAKPGTPPVIQRRESDGTVTDLFKPAIMSITGKTQDELDTIYTQAATGNQSVFIPETGELLLCDADKQALVNAQKAGHHVTAFYEKTNWQKGDLRPEHYFMCCTPDVPSTQYPKGVEYNYNRISADGKTVTSGGTIQGFKEQEIVYEIAFNQSIQINTHANDVYFHDMGRDIDELVNAMQQLEDARSKVDVLTEKLNANPDDHDLQSLKLAADKELVFLNEKMHNMFENAIGTFEDYQKTLNKEISRIGAMTQRLELTKNRVEDQQSNVEELADKNINIDIDEIGLDYTSAKTALEAARLAAGQIAESTLLNYI